MRKPLVVSPLLLLLVAAPLLTGCEKVRARAQLKEGNRLYQTEAYAKALEQYKKGLKTDPTATFAWRSAGLSALAIYKPGDDSPENIRLAEEAINAFEKYIADYPDDTKIRDYLLGLYVNAKKYDQGLAYADQQLQADPNNGAMHSYKIRLLIESGRFDQAWQMAQQHQGENRAEVLYSVGVKAWEKAYNDASLDLPTRTRFVDTGLEALESSLKAKPDYIDAATYYNLLLREKAKLETDATRRAELIAEADEWQKKAIELRKQQAAKEQQQQAQAGAPQAGT